MLEHSTRKRATCPVEFHWMRSGTPGWEISKHGDNNTWRANVEPGHAWKSPNAWGTPFSAFRFAIPEVHGFQGRAVYVDADMLVLGDVRELLEMPLVAGYHCISDVRTDVSVIDCAYFKDKSWWPSIEKMKPSGWLTYHYREYLKQHKALAKTLPVAWNTCDLLEKRPDPGISGAKLLHYTTVPTQPYRPYPTVRYAEHPWASWVKVWNDEHAEALAASA